MEPNSSLLLPGGQTPKAGEAPGQLRPPPGAEETRLSAVFFNAEDMTSADPFETAPASHHRWVNATGLSNVDALKTLLTPFGVNALHLEDILSVRQRAHTDELGERALILLPMVRSGEPVEQLAILTTEREVITIQERDGDVFDAIRTRLKDKRARMRKAGAPYLAYAMMDAVIDGYFPLLENLAERIETAEQSIMDEGDVPLSEIHSVKREVTALRRLLRPMRDAISGLIKSAEDDLPPFNTLDPSHLRDCRDHLLQLLDLADAVTDTCNDVRDMIAAQSDQKLNQVMGMLTVIATIFMPLGFLAGIWGMNFDTASPFNLPELGLKYGYPMALGFMATIGIGLVLWFKKKGWL